MELVTLLMLTAVVTSYSWKGAEAGVSIQELKKKLGEQDFISSHLTCQRSGFS